MTTTHDDLAARQAALVRALVAGAPIPVHFDAQRVQLAADALLRKRSGEVAAHLPLVRAQLGAHRFTELFCDWARGRPREGSARDAAAFAEHLRHEGYWRPPRRRWFRAGS